MRIAFVPLRRELLERRSSLLFRGRLIDLPQVSGHRLPFFPGHIPERVPDLVDDALLDVGPGEDGLNRLGDPLEVVDRKDENVLDTPVFQLIEDREPVLGGFGLGDPQSQAFLLAVQVDPDDGIEGHIPDMTFQPHFQEHGIHVDQGIDGLQRPALPFPGPLHDSVRDGAHRLG